MAYLVERQSLKKDQENRLMSAFLAPAACCTIAKHFLPLIVLDGTFTRGQRGGTFLIACMQDGNTETVVMCIAFVPSEARSTGCGFVETSEKALIGTGTPSLSYQTEEEVLFLCG